jgi:hypothetical protein
MIVMMMMMMEAMRIMMIMMMIRSSSICEGRAKSGVTKTNPTQRLTKSIP